jgi:hypothetical protein
MEKPHRVGLGRAYSLEMSFAIRLVEAEGIQIRVYTSEAHPAKSSEVF